MAGIGQDADVCQGVTVSNDDVRQLAHFQRTQLISLAHHMGCIDGAGLDGFPGGHARPNHSFKLLAFLPVGGVLAVGEVRAEGDAEAARYYEVFKANPELAAFLRKLDSLRRIMRSRTTLVLDTGAAPFDLLNADAAKFGPRVR